MAKRKLKKAEIAEELEEALVELLHCCGCGCCCYGETHVAAAKKLLELDGAAFSLDEAGVWEAKDRLSGWEKRQ